MNSPYPIGNQTALAASRPLEPFRFGLRHRFDAFEWFEDQREDRGFAFAACDAACRRRLRDLGRRRGVVYTVHAALSANLADPDDKALGDAIGFARDLGAGIVVLHFPLEADPSEAAAGLTEWAERAGEAQVALAVENTPATSPQALNALFERAFAPAPGIAPAPNPLAAHAGVCFDMGHANLHPDFRHDYIGYLDRIAPHVPLRHVHVHENHGDADSHLTLFTGPAATDPTGIHLLLERLHRRAYRGVLIMEQWPTPPTLLTRARDRLRRIMLDDHHG